MNCNIKYSGCNVSFSLTEPTKISDSYHFFQPDVQFLVLPTQKRRAGPLCALLASNCIQLAAALRETGRVSLDVAVESVGDVAAVGRVGVAPVVLAGGVLVAGFGFEVNHGGGCELTLSTSNFALTFNNW